MGPYIEHKLVNGIEKKYCSGCDDWHILDSFAVETRKRDGLKTQCKNYINEKERDRIKPDTTKSDKEKQINKLKRLDNLKTPTTEINGIIGKICSDCNVWISLSNFTKDGLYFDGTQSYRGQCNDCRSKERIEKAKIEAEIKKVEQKKIDEEILKNHIPIPKKVLEKKKAYPKDENGNTIYSSVHKIINNIEMKFCTGCEIWHPFTDEYFNSDPSKKDGRASMCKTKQKEVREFKKCTEHGKVPHLCKICYPIEYKKYYDYIKEKRNTDIKYKIKENLRHRLYMAAKNSKKESAIILIGCTIPELWEHLKKQFIKEPVQMTKENHGTVWHIDHIIPCNAFDLNDENEQRRCFHFKNLQPMYPKDNIIKSDDYVFNPILEIELYFAVNPEKIIL